MTLQLTINLSQLTGAYVFEPNGGFRSLDPAGFAEAAQAVVPGCEDLTMVETATIPGSSRQVVLNPWAERDQPFNPLGSQFLGRPVYGAVAVLPIGESSPPESPS